MKKEKSNTEKSSTVVILYNIRSSENVGAMFRTADSAGVGKIYLIGYTPAPTDRFGRKNSRLTKASLGAEEFVAWESKKTIAPLLVKLRKEKYQIIAVEQDEHSIDYRKVRLGNKNAFIVGREVEGIPKSVLDKCDVIAEIPMKGKKESLNVSVSLGIILFLMN